jgi:hypothetical protein
VVKSSASAPRLRRILLALVGLLYLLSIPWYRRGGEASELWLGLPDWVTVALLCYAGAALLNAIAWLLTDVPDDERPGGNSR